VKAQFELLGSTYISRLAMRDAWAFVGQRGLKGRSTIEEVHSAHLFYYMAVRFGACLLPTSINLMLHGITVSEKFLMLVGAKVLNRCYFTVALCLFHYL